MHGCETQCENHQYLSGSRRLAARANWHRLVDMIRRAAQVAEAVVKAPSLRHASHTLQPLMPAMHVATIHDHV